jgi:small-conductance mechanosensitive channel
VGSGKGGLLKTISLVWLFLAVLVFGMLLLHLRRVPTALAAVTDPVLNEGLRESIAKVVAQGVIYPLAFAWMGIRGWKFASSEVG